VPSQAECIQLQIESFGIANKKNEEELTELKILEVEGK